MRIDGEAFFLPTTSSSKTIRRKADFDFKIETSYACIVLLLMFFFSNKNERR